MLLYFITCISFVLFFKSLLPLKPLPAWANEMRLVSLLFCIELLSIKSICKFIRNYQLSFLCQLPSRMSLVKKNQLSKVDCVEDKRDISMLDLPDLALECILEKLSPAALCRMASVCHSLRERCVSDYFWERHMKQKWGRVVCSTAHREWQWYTASERDAESPNHGKQTGLMRLISLGWPFSWIRIKVDSSNSIKKQSSLPVDSVMTKYLALETGNFWFHSQVYNRENGHVGFVLSCYDAEVSYDPCTDTFQARYPPHGRRAAAIEHGIPWERLRAPPVDTSPHDLHISNCLNHLRPGDHIEIQWKRNREFPYGWWYGVVGHLESCDGNEFYCHCHSSDTLVLEFNQYTPGSRWRRTTVNRRYHREEGNEADGFYGGIRKIENENEISVWKRLWPSDVLD